MPNNLPGYGRFVPKSQGGQIIGRGVLVKKPPIIAPPYKPENMALVQANTNQHMYRGFLKG